MLNRSAILVRPKKPFLDWAEKFGDGMEYPVDDCERNVYLLPGFETYDEAEELLRQFAELIFEAELIDWRTDVETWPKDRSYDTFRQWFDVEHDSVIFDLVAGSPLDDDEAPA